MQFAQTHLLVAISFMGSRGRSPSTVSLSLFRASLRARSRLAQHHHHHHQFPSQTPAPPSSHDFHARLILSPSSQRGNWFQTRDVRCGNPEFPYHPPLVFSPLRRCHALPRVQPCAITPPSSLPSHSIWAIGEPRFPPTSTTKKHTTGKALLASR